LRRAGGPGKLVAMAADLPPLPAQPAATPWPTHAWPEGRLELGPAAPRFHELVEAAFAQPTDRLGEAHAALAIQHGRLVFERYAPGFDAASTHHSWSMAKSMTHALVGIAVHDGLIDIHAPADVPEWAGDSRRAITLDQLLRMSSGLSFVEDYVPGHVSDVREMLFASGKGDVAGYAAALPLEHEPGSFFSYSSGTTNIVSRVLGRALGKSGDALHAFMTERLFAPLGMTSPIPKFDEAGTFIGSSFCFCTARDFARFGLLYLRDGVWEGRRILPEGWVDYARTPTYQQPGATDARYGAHWWLDFGGPGSFSANGYDGQFIVLLPEQDVILVRHGVIPLEHKDQLKAWIGDVAACFRTR
jgi:CubicO group peptidase (beta-lactamase class C family)